MSLVDRLLGREEIKHRAKVLEQKVEDLKKEKQRLKKRYEKDRKRTKEAVSKKQKLHEKINRQENKIESLKDRLQKREIMEEARGKESRRRDLDRQSLRSVLGKLGSMESDEEDLYTIYLPEGSSIGSLSGRENIRSELKLNQLEKLKRIESPTGKVLFYSPELVNVLVLPPLPVEEEHWSRLDRFMVDSLKEQLENSLGFVFLSAGGSGVGIFDGEVKQSAVVGSDISSKHGKGGFSQDRFSEKRKEEVKSHVREVEERAEELLEDVDYVILSGSGRMINEFKAENMDAKVVKKKLDLSRITEQEDFEKSLAELWKSTSLSL